jgi:hypothetical protein
MTSDKTIDRWLRAGLGLCVLLVAGLARADVLGGLGSWHGTGTRFDSEGRPNGDFKVELTRRADGADSVKTLGKILLPDGAVFPFEQRWTRTSTGFVSDSPRGRGRGGCLSDNLCYNIEDLGGGRLLSSTIMVDAPNRIRILITEFDGGRPVEFIQETLVQK